MVVRRPARDRHRAARARARRPPSRRGPGARRRLRDRLQPAGSLPPRPGHGHRPRAGGARLLQGAGGAGGEGEPPRAALRRRHLRRRHVVRRPLPRLGDRRPRGGRRDGARPTRRGGAPRRVPALRAPVGRPRRRGRSRHRYTRSGLVALLGSCGLRVERATYCNSILFPCSGPAGLSTALSGAKAPTWASCPLPSSGPSKRPPRRGRAGAALLLVSPWGSVMALGRR